MMGPPTLKRLFPPQVPRDVEWRYLVHETYVADQMVIPLLEKFSLREDVPTPVVEKVREHIVEEKARLALYSPLLEDKKIIPSGFREPFENYVDSLRHPTLVLFALRALLEGLAQGALEYRLNFWKDSPSREADRMMAKRGESLPFSSEYLRGINQKWGTPTEEDFLEVRKRVGEIFKWSFSGEALSLYLWENHRIEVTPKEIEGLEGMNLFRKKSSRRVMKTVFDFMRLL